MRYGRCRLPRILGPLWLWMVWFSKKLINERTIIKLAIIIAIRNALSVAAIVRTNSVIILKEPSCSKSYSPMMKKK